MNKVIGYVLAVVGLGILFLGAGDFGLPVVSLLGKTVVSIIAMICIGGGVVIILMNSSGGSKSSAYQGKRKQKSGGKIQDLPVYEGDDIVAYRRD